MKKFCVCKITKKVFGFYFIHLTPFQLSYMYTYFQPFMHDAHFKYKIYLKKKCFETSYLQLYIH